MEPFGSLRDESPDFPQAANRNKAANSTDRYFVFFIQSSCVKFEV
jgi:hypothetical protein